MVRAKKREPDLDIPEGWEIHEEPVEEEKKSGFQMNNNLLWALFIVLVIAFTLFFMSKNLQPKEMQTIYINGIEIQAPYDPEAAVRDLVNMHIEGKRLDDLEDSKNALNEISVIIGQSSHSAASPRSYTLYAGLGDRTGIFIDDGIIRIEGTTRSEFWKAVWTFNSIISGLQIKSDVDIFDVPRLLEGRREVYLVQNMENTCPNYGHIISAEGDILSSLGFKQAELGFELNHYRMDGDVCAPFANETFVGECPQPSDDVFVIKMMRGRSDLLNITSNEIVFQYSDCNTVDRISIILGDIIYPNIASSIASVGLSPELEVL